MYQYDDPTAVAALPAPAAPGSPGFFTDGNPASGAAATILRADFMNMLMMELINLVAASGQTLNKTAYNQVLLAIKRLVQSQVVLADTGAVNAYAAENTPALVGGSSATWVNGVVQQILVGNTNNGPSTYAPDGLPPIPIYGPGLQPLQGNEMFAGGIAALMKQTIAGVNGGSPICVLLGCSGGARQVAAATKSQHAMQLGQANAVLLQTAAVTSGVASIDFTGLGSDGYSQYIIEIDDLTPSGSNVELWMRFSVGGSFLSTAIYAYAWSYVNISGVGGAQGSAGTNQIQLLNGIISGMGLGTAGRIAVYSPHSTAAYKRITWDMQNANNAQTTRYYGASSFTNLGSIDGIRLLMSSGNIATATVKLYGVN